jgi:transcriptional regulator with XRE-family HTH domain
LFEKNPVACFATGGILERNTRRERGPECPEWCDMAKGLTIDGAGKALARLREELGLNVTEAAIAFGTDKGLISRYENNKVAAPEHYLAALAKCLKRSTTAIVLECLKERDPLLAGSKFGRLLDKLAEEISNEY